MNPIAGISSMIRDLGLLTDRPDALERAICQSPDGQGIDPTLLSRVELRGDLDVPARVGDVVLFRPLGDGAYLDMETLWGGRVPLTAGRDYIGVLCERGSTKLITAELPPDIRLHQGLKLQMIAQAGGVGWATGFSPSLAKETGSGRSGDVEILGALCDRTNGRVLNTLAAAVTSGPPDRFPPSIVVVGTATDVGKTTAACALIRELAKDFTCAAVKASGTGWYEDSLLHSEAGAAPVLNFTFAGLPTTYYVPEGAYLRALYQVYAWLAVPDSLPAGFLPPGQRERARRSPEVVIVEHGGDLIWANIPSFLGDAHLMASVRALVICCESALALLGALCELGRLGLRSSEELEIFAAVPLANPEGFYRRLERTLAAGALQGIVDFTKPDLADPEERRCAYSKSYDRILSCADLAGRVAARL